MTRNTCTGFGLIMAEIRPESVSHGFTGSAAQNLIHAQKPPKHALIFTKIARDVHRDNTKLLSFVWSKSDQKWRCLLFCSFLFLQEHGSDFRLINPYNTTKYINPKHLHRFWVNYGQNVARKCVTWIGWKVDAKWMQSGCKIVESSTPCKIISTEVCVTPRKLGHGESE